MTEKEGSTFKVPLTTIQEIFPHPGADRLEYAKCYDFNVVVQKGKYNVGDVVLYVPIDSILPQWLEEQLFPADSKIKLHKSRVKQIKIRGGYSQGMIVPYECLTPLKHFDLEGVHIELDFSKELGITKYEAPAARYQQSLVKKRNKPLENPYFHKYGGIDNAKWYPDLFVEGEEVSITEKIHGTHVRFGYAPFVANTLWKHIKKLFGFAPTHEWVYGSNNVQLQNRSGFKGFYGEDVYGQTLAKYGLKDKVLPGELFNGEVYGDGIQGGYEYGCKGGITKLVLFDMKLQTTESSDYLNVDEFQKVCIDRELPMVPELYRGPFSKELAKSLTIGDSVLAPSQKVREGVVIKPVVEKQCYMGRKMLKMISEKYLESDQTDFH